MKRDDIRPDDGNRPVTVEFGADMLQVHLADGRIIATPLSWYPRLMSATQKQLENYELSPVGVHWQELDEDLSVIGMLQGIRPTSRKLNA